MADQRDELRLQRVHLLKLLVGARQFGVALRQQGRALGDFGLQFVVQALQRLPRGHLGRYQHTQVAEDDRDGQRPADAEEDDLSGQAQGKWLASFDAVLDQLVDGGGQKKKEWQEPLRQLQAETGIPQAAEPSRRRHLGQGQITDGHGQSPRPDYRAKCAPCKHIGTQSRQSCTPFRRRVVVS